MRRMVIMCLKKRVNLFYLLLLIFLSLTETDLVNAEKSLIAAGNIDLNTTRSEPDPKAEYSPKAHFQIHGKEEEAGLNICENDFDTMSAVDDDIVLFFGKHMYSRALNKFVRIRDAYKELPATLTRIDAYYFDPKGYEYFFVGRDVYVFYEGSFVEDTSKRLSNNPLIMEFSRATAVLKRDGEIFIICVHYYYTVDEQFTITSGGQAVANLIGESKQISSAFTDSNGVTYIIVGREYWRLDWKTHELAIEPHSIEELICSFCKGNVHQPKCCGPFPQVHFQMHGKEEVAGLNICTMPFNTISTVGDDMVLFFGKHMYSRALNKIMLIRDAYKELPANLTKIDTYFIKRDGSEYFFVRGNMYVFRKGSFLESSSGDLRKLKFPSEINRVTAVLQDRVNIVVVSDEYYWTTNEQFDQWIGPYFVEDLFGKYLPITSMFKDLDGVTYLSMNGMYFPLDWNTQEAVFDKRHFVEDLTCSLPAAVNREPPKCCKNAHN